MKHLNFVKGILIGIAKIIPGFSGAVLMISFNLYDKAIMAVTHFFDDVKKNFLFLIELGLGILLGIVLFSKVLSYFLTHYYFYTISLFIGLIFGGIPAVSKHFSFDKKNIFFVLLSFLLGTMLSFFHLHTTYVVRNNAFDLIIFFIAGVLEAVGTVMPGISSTALLMLLGIYPYYIHVISGVMSVSLLRENLFFLVPFSLGLFFGVIFISLLVNYLFSHYKEETFSVIFGFSLSSVFLLFIQLFDYIDGSISLLLGIFFLWSGYFISSRL